ncbi:MAG: winged helix-turn-helix domain-containing protein [Methanosarcina sp.]|jgi:predicted transcriptional regulator|uniref:helix-turn-helix transcriptional regulator n=1 Tax=Methanosarcina sp. TaxID=2213 RepID=UPI002CEFA6F0|nr:winged helix-turn-helix domain-containing protein [Methanosarcina sp.]MDM7920417.1 winged helix-turn-helix domain-containing protein [Methanosarcina sp.]HOW13427.1 winged helix-turn-helix domain-containing protein [Methanosarcina sp.]
MLEGANQMKLQLVNLLLFSEKRKDLVLLLEEKPRSIDEILDMLQISRVSLLPHIKKLKEEGLILQQGDIYSLSIIGSILVKKASPLLDAASTFEGNDYYWGHRKLDSIPFHLLKRIGDLKGNQLLEPGLTHGFDLFPELIDHFTESSKVMLLFSFFHPLAPSFSMELAKKNVQVQLIFSRDSFDRFSGDFRDMGEQILAKKNASVFVYSGLPLEIPALVAISDSALLLGLFNKKGRFEGQYLLGFEPRALVWGRELFEYYKEKSEKVSSIDSSGSIFDN